MMMLDHGLDGEEWRIEVPLRQTTGMLRCYLLVSLDFPHSTHFDGLNLTSDDVGTTSM